MLGNHFTLAVNYHATMAANARGEYTLPFDASLVHVSFGNSAASDATLDVGTSADRNGIIAAADVGDSGVPAEITPSSFDGALATAGDPYHLVKGTIFTWDIDFDGSAGTAAANATLVFTFSEG